MMNVFKNKKNNIKLTGIFLIIFTVVNLLSWFVLGIRMFPALNLKNAALYLYLIALITVLFTLNKLDKDNMERSLKIAGSGIIIMFVFFLVATLVSSKLLRSKQYANISNLTELDKPEIRISATSKEEVPIIDRETADRIGNRAMGTIPEFSGIYQAPKYYTTIVHNDSLARVAPLEYSGFFSWIKNKDKGLPAYINVNMTTGEYELIKLDDPIKYSSQEYFKRDVMNLLKRTYITKMWFAPSFEIDDQGHPYWVVSECLKSIALAGNVVGDVYIVDAITGEIKQYDKNNIPDWVDRVYPTDDYLSYISDKGMLTNGIKNAIFAKTNTYKTTSETSPDETQNVDDEDKENNFYKDGFSYIALEDKNNKKRVYAYTGITSGADKDDSNIGFALLNNRDGSVEKYDAPMVEEYSAMSSAQGSVQEKGYIATFPTLLVNNNNFIYFMNLKDQAGLTKEYAIVDADDYQKVYIGSTVNEVFEKLDKNTVISKDSNIDIDNNDDTYKQTKNLKLDEITVNKVFTQVKDGNTEYIIETSDNKLFVLSSKDDKDYKGVSLTENDKITVEYEEKEAYNLIKNIK